MSIIDQVISLTKDDSGKLQTVDYETAVTAAIRSYSKARPRLICSDVAGQDGPDIALPADWSPGYSNIELIEFPIGRIPESLLERSEWRIYKTPTDIFIRFASIRPAASEEVRLLYSVLHAEESIPEADQDAVAQLAASMCLLRLAAVYGNANDSTIMADSVQRQSKIDEYRRLAGALKTEYNLALGLRDDDTIPAAMVVVAPPQKQRGRLTHRD